IEIRRSHRLADARHVRGRPRPHAQPEERLSADFSARRSDAFFRATTATAMTGYLRTDGRKGIRNVTVVVYLVECAHHVAREVMFPFREQGVHLLGFPGCYPNAYAHRMLRRLCTHPNVGAVLLVSLGCEGFNRKNLLDEIRAT